MFNSSTMKLWVAVIDDVIIDTVALHPHKVTGT